MYYENGDMYFGYFKRGLRHGYGKMWFKDGTLYVGYWNKDERDGLGMLVESKVFLLVDLVIYLGNTLSQVNDRFHIL